MKKQLVRTEGIKNSRELTLVLLTNQEMVDIPSPTVTQDIDTFAPILAYVLTGSSLKPAEQGDTVNNPTFSTTLRDYKESPVDFISHNPSLSTSQVKVTAYKSENIAYTPIGHQ